VGAEQSFCVAYLAPIVTENDGWALFITTARGRNHAKSMLDMARRGRLVLRGAARQRNERNV
jgi:NADPH:quinone reductase-like Zn-dependent oxidoreductase